MAGSFLARTTAANVAAVDAPLPAATGKRRELKYRCGDFGLIFLAPNGEDPQPQFWDRPLERNGELRLSGVAYDHPGLSGSHPKKAA